MISVIIKNRLIFSDTPKIKNIWCCAQILKRIKLLEYKELIINYFKAMYLLTLRCKYQDVIKAFSKAIRQLNVNQILTIIRSQNTYHLICSLNKNK